MSHRAGWDVFAQCREGILWNGRAPHARWFCAMQILLRSALVFIGYWLAYLFAGVFDVNTYISAVYFPAGVTVAASMMLGLAYWPLMLVAIGAMPSFFYDVPFVGFGYLEMVRELVVYGLAGLYLRTIWMGATKRVTLKTVTRFIAVALLACLISTLITRYTFYDSVLQDGDQLLAFLGGDFAGVVIGVPVILSLRRLLLVLMRREAMETSWKQVSFGIGYGLFAFGVALLTAWLPAELGVKTHMLATLMFFPIIVAGLSNGIFIGFMAALVSCITYLNADAYWSPHQIEIIDIQMIFAISSALSLLAGAARDDRVYEWERANFDALTGLPNRRMLSDRMEQEWLRARRNRKRLGILYIDLDRFKQVNDRLGHDAGDQLLVEAAKRIRQCVRISDTVARIGGDEFVVLLSDLDDPSSAESVARKIRLALEEPFTLGEANHVASVSGSIGIAIYPDHGTDPELLKLYADAAMYLAKTGSRESVEAV